MKKNKYFDIVMIISIIFLCLGFTGKVIQNDLFYTIKIGDLILKNGIDMQDHFSWISNLAYTYPHWLYDVFMSILYKIGEFRIIYISSIVFFIIIGLLTYFISKKKTNNYFFAGLITIFTIGFLSPFVTARAQLISYIIFILEKYFLDRFLEDGKKKDAFIIIFLSLILVNIHLATWIFFFVLFLPPIASHYVTRIINKIRKKDEDLVIGKIKFTTNKNTYKLFIIIALCLLTGLLTPLGTTPYTYIFKQFMGNTFDYIQEYAKASLSNSANFYQYFLVLLVLFLLTKETIKLENVFLLLGLTLMTLMNMRSFSYFIIMQIFITSDYFKEVNRKLSKKAKDQLHYIFTRKSELIIITTCFVVVGCFLLYTINTTTDYYSDKVYPTDATKYILENLDTENIHLFNDYNYGSYLLFNDIKVFVDSRSDLYTKPFNPQLERDIFDDFVEVEYNMNYEEVFEYYDITHVLLRIEDNPILIKFLDIDNNYEELYSDDYFILYQRIE